MEGCSGDDIITRSFGLNRLKRDISLEQIRDAIAANPFLQQQLSLSAPDQTNQRLNSGSQQQSSPIRMNNCKLVFLAIGWLFKNANFWYYVFKIFLSV